MNRPSAMVFGSLNEREMIHTTGTSDSTTTIRIALPQPKPLFRRSSISVPLHAAGRRGGAEALDEDRRDDRDHQEDEHGDRRSQPQVQSVEQLVVAEDRDGLGP